MIPDNRHGLPRLDGQGQETRQGQEEKVDGSPSGRNFEAEHGSDNEHREEAPDHGNEREGTSRLESRIETPVAAKEGTVTREATVVSPESGCTNARAFHEVASESSDPSQDPSDESEDRRNEHEHSVGIVVAK